MAILSSFQLSPVSSPVLLLVAATVVLSVLYRFILYPAFLSPLAKVPAARWHARISPLYSYYIKYANIENREVHKLHSRYGPVVRLAPNELSVNCLDGLKAIYTADFPKTDWYHNRFCNFETDNIFTTKDSKQHGQRKRLLSHAYSKSTILSSSAIVSTTSTIILDRLFPILRSGKPVDIHPLNYAYSIDSFTAFQLGAKLGTNFLQDAASRSSFLYHFFAPRPHTVFWEVEVRQFTAALLKFLRIRLVPKWCDESRIANENYFMDKYDQAAHIVAAEKQSNGDSWPTIYATATHKYRDGLASALPNLKELYPDLRNQIATDMFDQTVAAVETSGNVLSFLHFELARNQDIQTQLRAELCILSSVSSNDNWLESINIKTLDSLPLLDAIVLETLRLYPPVAGNQPRRTPTVCTIAGYDGIPPGVRVQASAWSLHRNSHVFSFPEIWKPERWICSDQELVEMRKWFWAFGSGARICLGKNFAVISMKMVVAAVYTHFATEFVGVEEDVIPQNDGYSGGPRGDRVLLQFREI
ncbi:cytochrome P450 [Apodospora peruviana]|uniref:Cytochrome P450 n=1 Tax=Apodospora peruviana TaxID=516989 RepID=A0AAE0LYW7_9PEZI|nr:cytochrome P450 [Apodospora peruviana]